MQITQVGYQMLRVTKQYENDRVEVVVAVGPKEDPMAALELARKTCDDALSAGRDVSLRDKLKAKMATPAGRSDLERYLAR
jgi:hypothetical protein